MIRKAMSSRALPCRVGLIKWKGRDDMLSLQHMKYGDGYFDVL